MCKSTSKFQWPILIHILIIIILSVASIYNAWWVLHDYIFDNTMTNVQIQKADNLLAYSDYMTVKYQYSTGTIFPGNWILNSTDGDVFTYLHGKPIRKDTRACLAHLEMQNDTRKWLDQTKTLGDDLTLRTVVDIASITDILSMIDEQFVVDFTADESDDRHVQFYANMSDRSMAHFYTLMFPPQVMSQVEKFLTREDTDRLVDGALSYITGQNYARSIDPPTDNMTISPMIDRLGIKGLEVRFPLAFLNGHSSAQTLLGLFPFTKGSPVNPIFNDLTIAFASFKSPNGINIQIDRSGYDLKKYQNKTMRLAINLENRGIYNSVEVRSASECSMCQGMTRVEECLFRCKVQSIVDSCQCLPFTYRRFFQTDTTRNSLPRCTLQNYGRCIKNVKYDQTSCADQKSIPCVVVSNQVDSTVVAKPEDEEELYKLELQITAPTGTYVIFQDKIQNTWMQMLGQVGGNLGLFLSFSLLSAWQTVHAFWAMFKNREGPLKPEEVFLSVVSIGGNK